jgi:hypothetical protein
MANRPKHRTAALTRRWLRVEAGLPADPSHRQRTPHQHGHCPRCRMELRRGWQIVMHMRLGCRVTTTQT